MTDRTTLADVDAATDTPSETTVRLDYMLCQYGKLELEYYALKRRVRELETALAESGEG